MRNKLGLRHIRQILIVFTVLIVIYSLYLNVIVLDIKNKIEKRRDYLHKDVELEFHRLDCPLWKNLTSINSGGYSTWAKSYILPNMQKCIHKKLHDMFIEEKINASPQAGRDPFFYIPEDKLCIYYDTSGLSISSRVNGIWHRKLIYDIEVKEENNNWCSINPIFEKRLEEKDLIEWDSKKQIPDFVNDGKSLNNRTRKEKAEYYSYLVGNRLAEPETFSSVLKILQYVNEDEYLANLEISIAKIPFGWMILCEKDTVDFESFVEPNSALARNFEKLQPLCWLKTKAEGCILRLLRVLD